ncbi:ATP-binding protein [Thermogemmatispora carboxidivorans]|uniref:ATP-binding protein n=1 Tax=Thermogemmatispora carboxidivorans TaxID=1382306 RepID=UPI00069CAC6F|nr:AAA family ATPase [Thermogemmatispora carboxidivorans]
MSISSRQLVFRLLGVPEVRIAGVPLVWHHQKAQALLYYLAASEGPQPREHLAALLWSEVPEDNARHSLRSNLYVIRRTLQSYGLAEALVVDGPYVSLAEQLLVCDVRRFRRLLQEGSRQALAEAVQLYRGRLLQGFTLNGTPLFDEWLQTEEAALSRGYLTALSHLATYAEQAGRWDEAIEYLQRLVREDPFSDADQRRLIELSLRAGSLGRAWLQYTQYEKFLQRELGLPPPADLQERMREALTKRRVAAACDGGRAGLRYSGSSGPGGQMLPFVGREEPLDHLLQLAAQVARTNLGATVLIQGEDGSGKTRLLDELMARLEALSVDWIVLRGTCSPFDELLAYGPFWEALQGLGLDPLAETPASASPSLGSALPEEQGRLIWSLWQTLRTLARTAPLLLAIDDLHWANSSTLQLFGFLALRVHQLPILLIGTSASVELVPALQRLLTLGRRHGYVQVLSLEPLAPEAVTALVEALRIVTLPGASTFPAWLYERSGGCPFILLELLRQLQTDGVLSESAGERRLDVRRWLRWRVMHALPETTYDLVLWRLIDLDAEARLLLEILAIANQPLPLALLQEMPEMRDLPVMPIVDQLLWRGLLIETASRCYGLSHALLREAVMHRLSQVRVQQIHRELAAMLERCPELQQDFPRRQIALHAVMGGDSERARRYGLQILDELARENVSTEVVLFLQQLYDLVAPAAALEEELRLTMALGRVYRALGQLQQAADWYRRCLTLARQLNDRVACKSAYFELGELALIMNDYREAIACAEAGLAVPDPPREGERLALFAAGQRLLGAALAMEGSDLVAAEAHLQEAACALRQCGNLGDLCAALFELGNIAAQYGQLRQALRFYGEAAEAARATHNYYFLALSYNNAAYHHLLLGELEAARTSLAEGRRIAETYELLGALLHLSSTQGELHLYVGEWRAATEVLSQGLALAEELGNLERQAGYRGGLALCARSQGRLEEATALLKDALALIDDYGYHHLRTRLQLWLAEVWLLRAQPAEAAPYLKAALATAQRQQRRLLAMRAATLWAWYRAACGAWEEAERHFREAARQAEDLALPLELARIQVLQAQAALQEKSPALRARALLLLREAQSTLERYQARGDLAQLPLVATF